MVCQRCISAVSEILLALEIKAIQITLGKVQIENNLDKTLESKLNNELLNQGFELLTSAKISLVNQIKSLIINEVHHNSQKTQNNFSNLLSNRLNYSYDYLSHQFSEIENKSIERFIPYGYTLSCYEEYSIACCQSYVYGDRFISKSNCWWWYWHLLFCR